MSGDGIVCAYGRRRFGHILCLRCRKVAYFVSRNMLALCAFLRILMSSFEPRTPGASGALPLYKCRRSGRDYAPLEMSPYLCKRTFYLAVRTCHHAAEHWYYYVAHARIITNIMRISLDLWGISLENTAWHFPYAESESPTWRGNASWGLPQRTPMETTHGDTLRLVSCRHLAMPFCFPRGFPAWSVRAGLSQKAKEGARLVCAKQESRWRGSLLEDHYCAASAGWRLPLTAIHRRPKSNGSREVYVMVPVETRRVKRILEKKP